MRSFCFASQLFSSYCFRSRTVILRALMSLMFSPRSACATTRNWPTDDTLSRLARVPFKIHAIILPHHRSVEMQIATFRSGRRGRGASGPGRP
jgi:hypothetical protein